ncbi:phosphoserine phosphatase SerB [Glaciecola petra]|uniref:Phosphoserine phosphatase n=1 Tax=Glaciecola petra TaxID=3075602 RepID=A0ABU2ZT37_9ALTE|nr:phosphoserine phosphatase SerB [Aestuariibacter sp. P117]MDT0595802.1 phosphoserine phosphatase SerB [Aestuariibacter sp. P117]
MTIAALFSEPSASVSIDTCNRILTDTGGIIFYGQNLKQRDTLNAIQDLSKEAVSGTQHQQKFNNQFVIVGQAINLFTIEKIVSVYFSSATKIIVSPHPLHQKLGRQAFIIELFADDKTSKLLLNKDVLETISQAFYIDCFKVSDVSLLTQGLLVMDMDSTIINMECIDEIATLVGVGDKVAALTERAMQGELDFNQSLLARVSCLKGISVEELEKLKSRLPINPGFAMTIAILQDHGWKTCIASGGFTYFANYLKNTFALTAAYSNELGIDKQHLSGEVEGDILNAETKRNILLTEKDKAQIADTQTIAIGDGANDLAMMQAASLGVAYKAKAKVKEQADANINFCGFEGLLYCLQQ